ncbi:hypothetical protein [Pedobacter frigiditerrae]|uniref:hypothetical protein n=1 Tax=Pedobacter frigiditerrae TaxID=2530452 RepID=UPI00292EF9CD|nr:hypothetical protein [Pedobacter frigiditerrae]
MIVKPFRLILWVEENIRPELMNNLPELDSYTPFLHQTFVSGLINFRELLFEQMVLSKKDAAHGVRQLVNISNTIHSYLYRSKPAWKTTVSKTKIKSFYICLLCCLEKVLEEVKKISPPIHMEVPITHYSLPKVKMDLKIKFIEFSNHLDQAGLENNLMHLLKRAIQVMINKKEITPANVAYCTRLMNETNLLNELDINLMFVLLTKNGFNIPEFYLYYVTHLKQKLDDIGGLHEQLEMLILEKDKLNGIPDNENLRMFKGASPIKEQLYAYLDEKQKHTVQILELRRLALEDDPLVKSAKRLKVNLPVAQLALFIRLQLEKGFFEKENIGGLFNFFAEHFYTSKTKFISGDSLRKKSTEVEFTTAQKLKSQLIAMLNWLNENHNLSNYK